MSLGVTTCSLPEGNVTDSVTRPAAPGTEQLPPPVPRDSTYPYDGGPANPVPMPRAEPGRSLVPVPGSRCSRGQGCCVRLVSKVAVPMTQVTILSAHAPGPPLCSNE
jgi:hypothetical protein